MSYDPEPEPGTPRPRDTRLGKERCPCGSKKQFRKCHGADLKELSVSEEAQFDQLLMQEFGQRLATYYTRRTEVELLNLLAGK